MRPPFRGPGRTARGRRWVARGHCWHQRNGLISPLLGPARLRRLLSSGLLWMREHSLPASASSASVTAVQSVLPESPFFPFFRKVPRRFCPSTGQDPAGVSNAGPNPRHQTSALGWQTGPVFSDPRIQPLLHELFRSVGILCIFFMNTCAPGRHGGRRLGMPGRREASGSAGSHPATACKEPRRRLRRRRRPRD